MVATQQFGWIAQSLLTRGNVDFLDLVLDTGFVVGLVLLLLVLFSVACWGIVAYKWLHLHKAQQESVSFLETFWNSKKLDAIYEKSSQWEHSPVAQVFRAGYVELSRSTGSKNAEGSELHSTSDLESINRAMRRAMTTQITLLESMVSFLATTGSTAPFVGLFGTVWGIMEAFQEIGLAGNATLATVAPGISEALIATATGLAAAIPAVVAYNYFVQKIKVLDAEMENFSSDFLNICKRHFIK